MNTRIASLSVPVFALLASATAFAQQPAAAPAEDAPPAAAGRGGGGGGRGGQPGTTLPGGPSLDDPAYVGFDFSKRASVPIRTPAEEQKDFVLQPGYRMDLVLSDPDIKEPAAIAFDGNGRMYVLELRGYMQDADAAHEKDPIGVISRHEDLNRDGVYEKHTTFVDGLIFPRFVTPFGKNAILTMESDADEVWLYTDTNNDGKADKRELWATGFGRSANVEHQQSFLTWTMDNWMYSTVNAFRARWTPGGTILKEPTGTNGAQWGVTQDNDGKQWFQGGASGMPGYFQFPVVYGNFTAAGQIAPELNIPWGAPVRIADMQGGMRSVRMPDGTLNGATAGAGNDIVRGHRMPKDLQGEYLYGEEVARIVRRIHPTVTEGVTKLDNAYKYNEFIKSTDPLFRPVDQATAPDGTVYIVDMYRGIIQQATWSGRGTYLRARIEQYDLDKAHSHGRIWRLSYEGVGSNPAIPRDPTMPRMLDESPAQLVAHLNHPNGWWRDTAQQLIVLSQDKSVAPALTSMVRAKENENARLHALWSLEGLGALTPALTREMMKDTSARMRVQAIRASETLYKAGDKSFAADYATLAKDSDAGVATQALLTMNLFKTPNAVAVATEVKASNKAQGPQLVASTIIAPPDATGGRGGRGGPPAFSATEEASYNRGKAYYNELCYACHGTDGRGEQKAGAPLGVTMAPALAGSPRVNGHRDYPINVVLKGLNGPINGVTYSDVMIPMPQQSDQWIADVLSYVRNSFGNVSAFVSAADVARARAASTSRTTPWTVAELEARLPRLVATQADWKISASNNSETARNAITFAAWNSGAPQTNGMWFQVELPAATPLTEIQFTAGAAGGGGRGGGGRGGIAGASADQTAAIAALTAAVADQVTAVANARTAVMQASVTNRAGVQAAVAALAQAELALATARADAFGRMQATPAQRLAAGQVEQLVASISPVPAAPAAAGTGYPRGYRVDVSQDGNAWTPVAQGQGNDGLNTIAFAPTNAKFVRITQTAATGGLPNWSMTNLRLFRSGQ